MNIKEGPAIRQFAAMIDVKPKEVVDWVNLYVNNPEEFDCKTEETVEGRLESIKGYINFRLENSVNARIRKQIEASK